MPQQTLGFRVALVVPLLRFSLTSGDAPLPHDRAAVAALVALQGRFGGPDVDPHQSRIEKVAIVRIQGIVPQSNPPQWWVSDGGILALARFWRQG
jgi:hypothetical protein